MVDKVRQDEEIKLSLRKEIEKVMNVIKHMQPSNTKFTKIYKDDTVRIKAIERKYQQFVVDAKNTFNNIVEEYEARLVDCEDQTYYNAAKLDEVEKIIEFLK